MADQIADVESGKVLDLQWVDTSDFGERPADRRSRKTYDLDPAPLDRLLAAAILTGHVDGKHMHAIADDDRDGPIHIVHLMAACEVAAREVGGGLPGAERITFDLPRNASELIAAEVGGDAFGVLVSELRESGFASATRLARALSPEQRFAILDPLLHYALAPLTDCGSISSKVRCFGRRRPRIANRRDLTAGRIPPPQRVQMPLPASLEVTWPAAVACRDDVGLTLARPGSATNLAAKLGTSRRWSASVMLSTTPIGWGWRWPLTAPWRRCAGRSMLRTGPCLSPRISITVSDGKDRGRQAAESMGLSRRPPEFSGGTMSLPTARAPELTARLGQRPHDTVHDGRYAISRTVAAEFLVRGRGGACGV